MKKAYICSPYAGDVRRNKEYARKLTRAAIDKGYAPITPHLYITETLNDNTPAERTIGLVTAIELLKDCSALIIGVDYGISAGMSTEIIFAVENGIPCFLAYELYVQSGALSEKKVKFISMTSCPVALRLIAKVEIR